MYAIRSYYVTVPTLNSSAAPQETTVTYQPELLDLTERESLLIGLYERINPGVVSVQTLSLTGGGLGTGFVYDLEGHIITNYHVVEDVTELEVDFVITSYSIHYTKLYDVRLI